MFKVLTQAALVAAIAFVIAVVTLSVRQLREQNHEANEQTSTEEAYKEPDNAATAESTNEAIARYTLWLMLFTGVLAVVGLTQIWYLNSADRTAAITASAAIRAADVAKAQLIASRRPWVQVGVTIVKAEFDSGQFNVEFEFSLTNKGADPAFYVDPFFKIVPGRALMRPGAVKMALEAYCKPIGDRKPGANTGGFTIFPEENRPFKIGTSMSKDDVQADLAADPLRAIPGPRYSPLRDIIQPVLIGCVDYRFGKERTVAQTWFAYDLGLILVAPGPVPKEQLGGFTPKLIDLDAFYAF